MKKLLKTYGLNSDMQYFRMILNSIRNGQRKQAINQFLELPKVNRIQFLKSLALGNWSVDVAKAAIEILFDFIYFSKPQ